MKISSRALPGVQPLLLLVLLVAAKSYAQIPTITTVNPVTGIPGITVATITGTNFSSTAANNIVYFGATKGTVTAAGTSVLNVTVPAGATYGPVSVYNTVTDLTAYSRHLFLPTYNNSGFINETVGMDPAVNFSAGGAPKKTVLGDIDGDGKADVIVIRSGYVAVYRNTSTSGTITSGSFASPVSFYVGGFFYDVAIGDLDRDGKPDLAVIDYINTVSVIRNTSTSGSISFASAVEFDTEDYPYAIAIGDLDKDGKADLVVANWLSESISVFRNTATTGSINSGSFATRVNFATDYYPSDVAIGDLDGDNKPDIAVANSTGLYVFRNTTTTGSIDAASFAAPEEYFASGGDEVEIADIDGDNKPELISVSSTSVYVSRNTSFPGFLSFSFRVAFTTGSSPKSVAIGDFNGDSKPDLAVANYTSQSISVLRNTSTAGTINSGSFATKVDFSTSGKPEDAVVGDIDGDGKPDIVACLYDSSKIAVLRNNPILPPAISAVTPLNANPGDTVSITGSGFNATAANNTVYFGATKATVTSAGTTSLTVTVPTGATYAPVSVNNTGYNYTGYSQYPFLPTFDNSTYIPGTVHFRPGVDFTTGLNPYSVAIGDLDGDGKPDLAVVNSTSNTVSVYRNTSSSGSLTSGSFAAKVDFATGSSPRSVAIGDLDGDGKPDLVVANNSSNTVSIFRNNTSSGSITSSSFAAKIDFTTGSFPRNVAIGDLDKDGKPDLAVTNNSSNTVSIFRNTSSAGTITSGSFAAKADFTTGSGPQGLALGDLDGDGKPDLVVVNNSASTVSVFRNTSSAGSFTTGSFATKVDFTTGTNPFNIAMGDLDGDGKSDIVTANTGATTVSVFRNTSSSGSITGGSFAAKVDFAIGNFPRSVALGDMDGDGKSDLAVANESSTVSVLRNTSSSGSITSGSFAARVDLGNTNASYSVAIGDLDGDGKSDLAVVSNSTNTVSIIRNSPQSPPPTISFMTPTAGYPGASVIIMGTNFNTVMSNNIVYFGATKATVTAASATSLTAIVPAGATYTPVSINNTALEAFGYSQYPFLPTFDNSAYIPGTVNFDPRTDFTSGTNPANVAVGDLDGDGKADLAVVNYSSNTVSVYRNTSASGAITSSSFATKVDFATGVSPFCVAIGDLDGDGKADLAVANNISNTVSVLRNTSSPGSITIGSFAARVDFTTGSSPRSVAIGDLDRDGKPDLVTANSSSATVSVLRNVSSSGSISSGSFTAKVDLNTGSSPQGIAIGDLDGDGKPDLVVTNSGSNTVSAYRNTSSMGAITSSSFSTRVDFSTGTTPLNVAISDLDGNGKADLAVANSGTNTVSIFRNTSSSGAINSSSFAAKVDLTTGSNPYSVAIGDFDGDSKPDIAVANNSSATVSVLRNTSTSGSITSGSFATKMDFATGSNPRSVVIGDLDGDSKPDLAVANYSSNTISVLRNNPLLPMSTTFSSTNVTCNGGNNGSAIIIASGGLPPYSYSWSPSGGTDDTATGLAAGTYTCTITDAGSRIKTKTITITQPTAIAVSPASHTNISCFGGSNGAASITIPTGGAGGYTYSWTPGNPAGDSTVSVSGLTANVYTCTVTDATSCTARVTFNVTQPTAVVIDTIRNNGPVCSGSDLNFFGTASGGTGPFNYSWSGPNSFSSTAQNPTIISSATAATGIYTLTVTDANGCVVTNTTSASVNSTPVAGTISGANEVCAGSSVTFTDTVSGGTWSSSDSSIATVNSSGIVTGVAAGFATITYTVTNGCGSPATTKMVTVNPLPNAGIITGPSAVIIGTSITLSDSVSGGSWSADSTYAIVSSGGVLTGVSAGVVTVSYSVTNGCGTAVATKTVSVNPAGITGTLQVCVGRTTSLTCSPTGGTWTSSNTPLGVVSSAGVVTGLAVGTVNITYNVSGSIAVATVTVMPTPSAITGSLSICNGATATLTSNPGVGTWSSADALVAGITSTGVLTGAALGTSTISYTLANGCSRSAVVTINNVPSATSGTTGICVGGTTSLSNAVSGGVFSSSNSTIATTSLTGYVTGIAAGTASISYSIGGCRVTTIVTVLGTPPVITGTTAVCAGASATLNNTESGGSWSSSNSTVVSVSTSGVITGEGIGTGTIYYTSASTGCPRSVVATVNAVPTISGPATICANGGSVNLTCSPATTSWTSSSPSVATISGAGLLTGIAAGTTTISVMSAAGCTSNMVISVNTLPLIMGTLAACINNTTSLSGSTPGGTWASNITGIASVNAATGVVTGVSQGTTTISYSLGVGCLRTAILTVNALPTIAGTPSMCVNGEVALSCSPAGGSWSSANPAIAVVSGTGTVTGLATGTTGIVYTNPTTGCSKTIVATVNASPAAFSGATAFCNNSATTLSNATPGGTWSSSNPTTASAGVATGIITGAAVGTAMITYRIGTCQATVSVNVLPLPNAITGTTQTVIGATMTLNNTTPGGTWSSSNPVTGTISATGIVTGLASGTSVIVYTAPNTCTRSIVVTVNTAPALPGPRNVCVGASINISSPSVSVSSWSSGDISIATVSGGIVTGVARGTATITYVLTAGGYAITEVTVLALPDPITGSLTVCGGATTTLGSTTSGGTWESSNPGLAAVDVNGVVAGVAPGPVTISYSLPTGCRRTVTVTVNVTPDAITGTASVCVEATMYPYLASVSSGSWSSSNTAVATVPVTHGAVSGISAGTAVISFTNMAGCSTTKEVTVSICPSRGILPGTTGIANLNGDLRISLYPNPTKGLFVINTPQAGTLSIYTIGGRELVKRHIDIGNTEISLPSTVTTGIYMCRFSGNEGVTFTTRLVFEAE